MPYIPNIITNSNNDELVKGCAHALFIFAGKVLSEETPIMPPNAGYKAYFKRVEGARKVLASPLVFAPLVANYVVFLNPDYVRDTPANGRTYHNDLVDNRALEADYRNVASGFSAASPTSGFQIFDAVVGVNQSDFI